ERMVATLQMEVAQRLVAKRGDEDYGVLTFLIQLSYQPQGWYKIPASCFFPEPHVDSACVSLARRDPPLLEPAKRALFNRIVKRSFSQRRKMMFKLLREDWPAKRLEEAFGVATLPRSARAENAGLEQFVRLTQLLSQDLAHG